MQSAVTVYLGLGTNLGDRESNIEAACRSIASSLSALRTSSIYRSAPMYRTDQPEFLNCVVVGRTLLPPLKLLDFIQRIETDMGRDREAAGWKGPRPIDIDILLYGDRILHTKRLVLPHPLMTERQFVLVPLIEIAPEIIEPGTATRYREYLDRLKPQGIYYYSSTRYSRAHGGADEGSINASRREPALPEGKQTNRPRGKA